MVEPLACLSPETSARVDHVLLKIEEARELYYRLILLVGPTGSGKTRVLWEISARTSAPLINVNLELSRRMLDMTERQRVLQLPKLLSEIVQNVREDLVLLDNMELLFDVNLKHDPLRLLEKLSRNKTIVATWNGHIESDYITYAVPGHPEYRRYQIQDFLVVSVDRSK